MGIFVYVCSALQDRIYRSLYVLKFSRKGIYDTMQMYLRVIGLYLGSLHTRRVPVVSLAQVPITMLAPAVFKTVSWDDLIGLASEVGDGTG